MRGNLAGTLWRLAIFMVICTLGLFFLLASLAEIRFDSQQTYRAIFGNVTGLKDGNFVRIGGVEVGKVQKISLRDDATVMVEFAVDDSVALTGGSRAVIRWENLIGDRYLALEEGAGSVTSLKPGGVIPLAQTQPALDLDALIGGFRPLFRALDPEQVNALTGQLIAAFQGQGDTIGSLLTQTAALTNTLADRDQLIGQVIVNLNAVLDSFGDQQQQFSKAVDSLSELIHGLAARKTDISDSVAYLNASAAAVADLLGQGRPPLQKVIHETDRTSGQILTDHDFFDDLLGRLPDAYRQLGRFGLHGDYFSFYLCDAYLKLNGKGGNPVYVKVVGQTSGRCAPKK
jgi:phospholipid/cholesterol/gamma-HCH transport system substrate-binding protein